MGPIEFFENLPPRNSLRRPSPVSASPKRPPAAQPVRAHGRERERQQLLNDIAVLAASAKDKFNGPGSRALTVNRLRHPSKDLAHAAGRFSTAGTYSRPQSCLFS